MAIQPLRPLRQSPSSRPFLADNSGSVEKKKKKSRTLQISTSRRDLIESSIPQTRMRTHSRRPIIRRLMVSPSTQRWNRLECIGDQGFANKVISGWWAFMANQSSLLPFGLLEDCYTSCLPVIWLWLIHLGLTFFSLTSQEIHTSFVITIDPV